MNEATIRQWYDVFKDNRDLVEIRILDPKTRKTYSGYFTDIETLLSAIRPYNEAGIYFTLNIINDACYSREQRDRISTRPKSTTSDNDIIARKWCMIDVDVEKPSDTNSSDEEKELAKPVVNEIYKFLRGESFETPVICDSSNGFHLCYKQNMLATPENAETMKKFLQVLDMYFSTEKVKIDVSTWNNSRICKLYGTISRKGSDTPERPQRESKILKVPDEIKATPKEYFEKVASYYPEPVHKDRSNNYGANPFDLDEFIAKYDIKVAKVVETAAFTKYVLANCPFDSSHSAPDSAVFKMKDGRFGFKCLHSSHSQYTFKDFRLHFDPNAYDQKDYGEYRMKRDMYRQHKRMFNIEEETVEKGKKWLCMGDIKDVSLEDMLTIKTGIEAIDKKIIGLFAGELTVFSGLSGAGKTSFLNLLALNAVEQGYKVGLWSGEMQDFRFRGWLMQIAAGKSYTAKKIGYDNLYYTPKKYADLICQWLDESLYLYNNKYGANWSALFADIQELVEREKVKLIVLDNLAALSIDDYDGDNNSKQKQFIQDVKDYAKQTNIHVVVVAHPRKENFFLRKESVSGTADLINLADNLLLIHRVSKDFEKRASEFFGADKTKEFMDYNAVIEVSKCRQMGVTDFLAGVYYEPESRRLKNSIAENRIYGWCNAMEESERKDLAVNGDGNAQSGDFVYIEPVEPNTAFLGGVGGELDLDYHGEDSPF